ncbi:HEAT repeat domain-containing protein [Streptomyces sp. NPDC093089]|uniref:HEAT repeat domain-containing protein n=1 Tax=Streptomyces sp. NPDC093089 TaxID=3366024 RepID=UPI00382D093A
MRGFFKRRKALQTASEATVQGPLTQISQVRGDIHLTIGSVPPQPVAPEIESAREAYATRVRQRYGRLDLEVLTPLREQDERPVLQLRDVFVPQSVRADPPPVELPQELLRRLMDPAEAELHDLPPGIDRATVDRVRRAYKERPPLPVLDVLTTPGHDRVVLLGHPGSGKSTLARYLALVLTSPEPPEGLDTLRGSLPLIVELREYAQPAWRERTFEDYLVHQHATEGLGLPPETLTTLLAGEGPYTALVIFDGLDELFEKDVRDAVTRRIAGFAARHPRARIVVTSRGYGYQRAVLDGAGFDNFMLQDLDRAQIGAFADQWFALACPDEPDQALKLVERVTTAVDASTSVRELAGNPLILTILAIIGRRRELPRDRRTVYEHAVDVLVEHWDPSKYLKDRQVEEHLPYLGPEDKRELLRLIARQMQEGHGGVAGNHIAGPDLLKSFEEYLKDRYALPPDRAAPAARVMLDQFRHRNFILSRYGGEIYGFVHRTFLEYLAATDLAHRFNQERSLSETDLQDLFATKVHDPTWQEILLLLVGLLDERFVAGIIDRLLAPRAIAVPLGGRGDRAFVEVLFVARCLAEVRRLGALAPQSRAMAREVIRLFDLAGALGVTFFYPYDSVGALGPVLMAIGGNWAGRDECLRWLGSRSGAESSGSRAPSVNSTTHLAMEISLYLGAPEGTPHAVHLAKTMGTSDDPLERIAAAGLLLLRKGSERGPLEAIACCVREDASASVRTSLLTRLGYEREVDPEWTLRLAVERLAHDASPRVRLAALQYVARHTLFTPDVRAVIERALDDPYPAVRQYAVSRLLGCSPRAMAMVRDDLGDEDADTRARALSALEQGVADAPAARALVWERLVSDESPHVVAAAIDAVASIGSDAPGAHAFLGELVGHAAPEVRIAALRCLAAGDRDERFAELVADRLARDEDDDVREFALTLTVQLADDPPTKRDVLVDRFLHDPSEEIRTHALYMLMDVEPDSTRDLLIDRATNHPDGAVRAGTFFWLMTKYGADPDAVGLVFDRAVHDDSSEVRHAALQGLVDALRGGSRDPDIAATVQDRFDHDSDTEVRLTALRVLADLRRDDPEFLSLLRRTVERDDRVIRDCAATLLTVLDRQSP